MGLLPNQTYFGNNMNFKKIASLLALSAAFASTSALADDQAVNFAGMTAKFDSIGTVLAGGDDVITFTGLASGTYDFVLSLSGQYTTLSSLSLNNVVGTAYSGGKFLFAGVEGTGTTPFVLTLNGFTTAGKPSLYSGELTVTAVPEPETYALMLAGLAAVGFVARRRKA